jgi:anti-anti-sigma regulatory factor
MIHQSNAPIKSNCIELPIKSRQETAIRVSEPEEGKMRIDLSVPGGRLSEDTLSAESLHRLLREGVLSKREVTLNLAGVDLEGTTIAALIRADRELKDRGGELKIVGVGRPLLQMLDIARLDSLNIEPQVVAEAF